MGNPQISAHRGRFPVIFENRCLVTAEFLASSNKKVISSITNEMRVAFRATLISFVTDRSSFYQLPLSPLYVSFAAELVVVFILMSWQRTLLPDARPQFQFTVR